MQVFCRSSNGTADVCCSVCGQGFALHWERQTKLERAQALDEIAKALRGHHYNIAGPEAHPQRGFLVPERSGTATFSGAAVGGNAPSWAL
ncbi:MAG TPA: hypothetical protein VKB38_10480 [Terracidiphilus sp.]|nr:hypothetical protein [Terracidiphilus sp.]